MEECLETHPVSSEVLENENIKKVSSFLTPRFGRHVSELEDCNGNVVAEGSILCLQGLVGIVLFGGYRNLGQDNGGHYGFYVVWNHSWYRHDVLYWLYDAEEGAVVQDSLYSFLEGRTVLSADAVAGVVEAARLWLDENVAVTAGRLK